MDFKSFFLNRKQHVAAFLSVFFWGIFAHGFMFLNKLSFHDDIGNFGVGNTWTQGRWMLGVLGIFNKALFGTHNFSTPWFEGLLSLLILGLSSALLIEIFEIKDKKTAILLGAVMASFPVITAFFGYMFTAWYYMIALFLCVLSAFLFCRCTSVWTWLGGGVAFTCAMGIYQAFIPFELSLLVLYMMKDVYKNDRSWKEYFVKAAYYAGSCLLSFIAYFLIEKFFLTITHHTMSTYKGMDGFGVTSVSGYLARILLAYKQFFLQDAPFTYSMLPTLPVRIAYLLLLLSGLLLVLSALYELLRQKKTVRFIQTAILLLLFPFTVKFILVMVPESVISSLMVYADILPVFFVLLLLEEKERTFVRLQKVCGVISCILILYMSVFYTRYANICYFKLQFQQEEAKSFFTTLSTRIQSLDGYSDKMPVAFLNTKQKKADYLPDVPEWAFVNTTFFSQKNLLNDYNWDYFMKFWCGYEPVQVEDTREFEEMESVRNMPSYPADASIAIVNNTIVVKF